MYAALLRCVSGFCQLRKYLTAVSRSSPACTAFGRPWFLRATGPRTAKEIVTPHFPSLSRMPSCVRPTS